MAIFSPGTNLLDASKLRIKNIMSIDVSGDGYTVTAVGGTRSRLSKASYELDNSLVAYLAGKTLYLTADCISSSISDVRCVVQVEITCVDGSKKFGWIDNYGLTKKCNAPENITNIVINFFTNHGMALDTDNTVVFEGVRLTLTKNAPWNPYYVETQKLFIGDETVKKVYLGEELVYSAGNTVTYVVDTDKTYTEEVDYEASCLSPKKFTPTKDGWTFVGWRKDTTASSEKLISETMGDEPITLYAVFKQDVTLTYYDNSTSPQYKHGTKYYNNGTRNNPSWFMEQSSKDGWTARGWAASSESDADVAYNNSTTITIEESTTIYGLYEQTIYLYYNGNGASSGSVSTQSGTRYYNTYGNTSDVVFELAENGFARTNYAFTGWDLGAVGDVVTLSSSKTAYAQWEQTTYYVYQNGTLASGITTNGFNVESGELHLGVGADNGEEADASATLQNIDFTNYSKLDIVVDYKTYANFGDSSVSYGIDSCWTTALPNSNNDKNSTIITIDISSHTGLHYIGFGVWARNDSSEPTWHANANVWIKEIRLYN